jgi:hypothetical protein
MVGREFVPETLVAFNELSLLTGQEDFTKILNSVPTSKTTKHLNIRRPAD